MMDTRAQLPVLGLKEYWYPALPAKKVGRTRPAERQITGEHLVFFRDDKGEVAAVHRTCTHRGASLAYADIHFKGTLTCPYHGWTFDGKGNLLAVLGEGPASTLPGSKGTKLRSYPTVTIKGTVFVWMGVGEPVDPQEDLPWQLFDPDIIVMAGEGLWKANWRPSMENFTDAHGYYVHRTSLEILLQPRPAMMLIRHQGPTRPPFHVVNERFLTFMPGKASFTDYTDPAKAQQRALDKREFQDVFPGLGGAKWPKTKFHYYLSRLTSAVRSLWKPTGPMSKNPEWMTGAHLPCTINIEYHRWNFTRCEVPIDAQRTNNYYFCSWRGHNAWQRFFWPLYFTLYFRWKMTQNFAGQDALVTEISDYTAPERLSPTDLFLREWRRFALEYGRDFRRRGIRAAEETREAG